MKRYFFFIFSFFISILSLQAEPSIPVERYKLISQENKAPSKTLEKILELFDVDSSQSWSKIIEDTQSKWYTSQERWDMAEVHTDKKDDVMRLLGDLECLKAIKPVKKHYDYAVILGATVPAVRNRLNYLFKLCNEGVRVDKVVFLGADTELTTGVEFNRLMDRTDSSYPFLENWSLKGSNPKTEIEMMEAIWSQTNLPSALKGTPTQFVATPAILNADGALRRADTSATLRQWMKEEPELSGECLVLSSQPYVGYQDTVVRTHLPHSLYIETVGPEANPDMKLSVHLKNLAGWILWEGKRREVLEEN